MSWSYRVMRQRFPSGEVVYQIHELYDKPNGWTTDGVAPAGDSVLGLREELHRMLAACDHPVLDYDTGKEVSA